MKRCTLLFLLVLGTAFGSLAPLRSFAQSSPTASRGLEPSAFLGLSGTYTGLESSRNAGLTAGLDVGFHPIFGLLPAVEVRGTYPIAKGQIVSEKDVLFGLRVQKRYSRVRPYADILFGRGELDYQNGGFIVEAQSFRYIQSTSNVFSPGVGVEIDLKDQYSLLFDGQFQHWNTPFDPGHIYSKTGTVAVVYRFNWLEHGHPGH